ncbi:hypothetical protein BY996DRAFT_6481632 [Phakopsora pachyrhizi]|nr:hypothetical protein BY996DRAFT_6481632 [Phakopsora pachyrhizi]
MLNLNHNWVKRAPCFDWGRQRQAGAGLGMNEGGANELRSPENVEIDFIKLDQELKRYNQRVVYLPLLMSLGQVGQVGQAGAWLGLPGQVGQAEAWLGWVLGRQGQAGAWLGLAGQVG